MAKNNIAAAARAFSEKWATHGNEKGEAQKFWLDVAVMEAYGFRNDMTEPEIVAELFKMYQKLTENK